MSLSTIAPLGEGGGFAALLDGMILVVDAESTRREAGRQAAEMLRIAGIAVPGAVITNRRVPIPERIYRRL
jgi:Mrp family chromosome partitioning ATPase